MGNVEGKFITLELKQKTIDELKEKNITMIEEMCIKQKHLSENENLEELITCDMKVLSKYNITQKQIYDLFRLFKCANRYKNEKNPDFVNEHFEQINPIGWCIWSNTCFKMNLHDEIFDVYVYVWGGAEECPILSFFCDTYCGYSWGDRDWFFRKHSTNEWLHIGDLLPFQIGNFGFFQGKNSSYRIDPKKLISFFNMKSNMNYEPNCQKYTYWTDWFHSNENEFVNGAEYDLVLDENELGYKIYKKSDHEEFMYISNQQHDSIMFDGAELRVSKYLNVRFNNRRQADKYSGHNIDLFEINPINNF